MKYLFFLFFPLFVFSAPLEPNLSCCTQDHLVGASISVVDTDLGTLNSAYQSVPNSLTDWHDSHGDANGDYSSPYNCTGLGVRTSYFHLAGLNTRNVGGTWVKDFPLIERVSSVECICNQESTSPNSLPLPPQNTVWHEVAANDCMSGEMGDISLYDEANLTSRSIVQWQIGCCGTNTVYYVAKPIICDSNQELFEGNCYDTCGVDGLVLNGSCVERASCKSNEEMFYDLNSDPGIGETPCEINQDNFFYFSAYSLFSDETTSPFTCCGVLRNPPDNNGTSTPDSNGTAVPPDNNGTSTPDSNGTVTPTNPNDTSSDLATTNSVLSDIKSEIKSFSTEEQARHDALLAVQNQIHDAQSKQYNADRADTLAILNSINTASSTAHADQLASRGKYDEIIVGLRDVKDVTTSIGEQAHADAQTAHTDASGIKDSVDALSDGKEEAEGSLTGIKDGLTNALNSANSDYSSILDTFSVLGGSYTDTPPVFLGTGEHVFSANIYSKDVVFDLSIFENLRPYFDILFVLMLAWINFKIYKWMFEFLIKLGV